MSTPGADPHQNEGIEDHHEEQDPSHKGSTVEPCGEFHLCQKQVTDVPKK